jgi:hypothetical protein
LQKHGNGLPFHGVVDMGLNGCGRLKRREAPAGAARGGVSAQRGALLPITRRVAVISFEIDMDLMRIP